MSNNFFIILAKSPLNKGDIKTYMLVPIPTRNGISIAVNSNKICLHLDPPNNETDRNNTSLFIK